MLKSMKPSLLRIFWLARLTFLEAVRQRFFAFLIVLGAAMVLSSFAFRFLDFGHGELKFIADFGFGGLFFFGSILALVMTAQLLFAEIDNRTALTLLAKPVSRTEFLLGKFAGIWIVLGLFVFVLSILLGVMLWGRWQELVILAEQTAKVAPQFSLEGVFSHALLQWFRLGVVTSMVLLISTIARTFLFAVVVGAMTIVAGQLQWLAQEALFKPAELNPFSHALLWLASRLLPNLQQFNIGDALALDPSAVATGAVSAAILSGGFYLIAYLFLASLTFQRREI